MASPFNSANSPNGATAPASDALLITPSNSVDLSKPCRAFYVAVAGNVRVSTYDGSDVILPVGAFQIIPLAITRVWATSTTATGIVGLTG